MLIGLLFIIMGKGDDEVKAFLFRLLIMYLVLFLIQSQAMLFDCKILYDRQEDRCQLEEWVQLELSERNKITE